MAGLQRNLNYTPAPAAGSRAQCRAVLRRRAGLAAGDGGNNHDAVAVLEAVGFAAEKADIFLVDIDIDELADAAGVVAEMPSHGGEFLPELGQQFGEGCRSAFDRRGAVREAAKGRGDFDDDSHFSALLQMPRGDFLAERFLDCATRHVLRACRQERRVAPLPSTSLRAGSMTPKTFISVCSSGDSGDFGGKDGMEIGFERREA